MYADDDAFPRRDALFFTIHAQPIGARSASFIIVRRALLLFYKYSPARASIITTSVIRQLLIFAIFFSDFNTIIIQDTLKPLDVLFCGARLDGHPEIKKTIL